MSLLNIGKINKNKYIISSFETSTRNSNSNISNGNKSKKNELSKSNSQCILPLINSSLKIHPLSDSTSILSKFITNHTSKLIKNAIDPVITPYNMIRRKFMLLSKLREKNINEKNLIRAHSLNDIFSNKNSNSHFNGLFITEKSKGNNNNNIQHIKGNKRVLSKIINKKIILDKNNIREEITNNKDTTNENDEESIMKEKDLNDLNNINLISDMENSSGSLTPKKNNSMSNDNKNNINNKIKYSRLCRYDPVKINYIKERKKSPKKDLDLNSKYLFYIYNPDIHFQANIFEEQTKLFMAKFKEYKSIINKKKFIEIFKSISFYKKIDFNKTIEETCGILYNLPKMILGDFYNLMLKLIKVKMPNEDKLLPKFVENEVSNVTNNNHLLIEISEYFNTCFEFYLGISWEDEGKDNYLKEKEYFEALNFFERARHNIISLNNSIYNAENNYNDDLLSINKIINNKILIKNNLIQDNDIDNNIFENIQSQEENTKNMKKNNTVVEKIQKQFRFRRNKEEEKIYRIESALGIFKEKKKQYNYLGKIIKNEKKPEYKSIFENKYFDKILPYCYKNAKNQIIIQKVNNEINSGKRGKEYQVIKINLG